jgi:hypothetical protein
MAGYPKELAQRVLYYFAAALSVAAGSFAAPAADTGAITKPKAPLGSVTAPIGGVATRPLGDIDPKYLVMPEHKRPGQHTLALDVGQWRTANAGRQHRESGIFGTKTCLLGELATGINGLVGWGQYEWDGDPCLAFVAQLAVTFDTAMLDEIPEKTIDRAVLAYDEVEPPFCEDNVLAPNRLYCWQSGGGLPEDKPDGCVVVRVPNVNWLEAPPPGLIPYAGTPPAVSRISVREWDVTEPFLWQHQPGATPLGAFPTYGFLLSGGPSLDQLTAEDSTVCLSAVSNIKLNVTYTVPPADEPFRAPK